MSTGAPQLTLSGTGGKSADEQILEHAQAILGDDPDAQLASTQQLRKFLSIERNLPIQRVIDAGAVPRLVQFLYRDDQPELQLEAAWALTNITSGNSDQCRVVVEYGVVQPLVKMLGSISEKLREQAAWALGNIAGDCVEFRDVVLASGALSPLLKCLSESTKVDTTRIVVWTLSNLCRRKPAPPLAAMSPALPCLAELLSASDQDSEVLKDACAALSCISNGTNDRIQAVIDAGVVPHLVRLHTHHDPTVVIRAVRATGNITTGNQLQTQALIDFGALPLLSRQLWHANDDIRKEAAWTLSNVTAGSRQQIQAVLDSGIIQRLVRLLQDGEALDVQKEAIWTISNAVSGGSPAQIAYLVQQGVLHRFCELLTPIADMQALELVFGALERILKSGVMINNQRSVPNPYAAVIEACGGVEKLEQLQQHQNEAVREPARRLLAEHFTPGSTASDRRNG